VSYAEWERAVLGTMVTRQWEELGVDVWMGEKVCPMRKRVRIISRRRDDWLDDGYGPVDGLILARWLSCCWLLHCSCHLLFISCRMKRERSVFVGRRCGFMHWKEEAAFAVPGIPTCEGTQTDEVGELFFAVGDGTEIIPLPYQLC